MRGQLEVQLVWRRKWKFRLPPFLRTHWLLQLFRREVHQGLAVTWRVEREYLFVKERKVIFKCQWNAARLKCQATTYWWKMFINRIKNTLACPNCDGFAEYCIGFGKSRNSDFYSVFWKSFVGNVGGCGCSQTAIMNRLSYPWKELNLKDINYTTGSELNPLLC